MFAIWITLEVFHEPRGLLKSAACPRSREVVKGRGIIEHRAHGGHVRRVPLADVFIEGAEVLAQSLHVSDLGDIPVTDFSILLYDAWNIITIRPLDEFCS